MRVADGEVELIPFPRHCWHSHSSRDGRLIVGDSNNGFFRGCASTVHFMNRNTGKVIVLADSAEALDEIDVQRAERALQESTERLRSMTEQDEDYGIESARVKRAAARLSVAG